MEPASPHLQCHSAHGQLRIPFPQNWQVELIWCAWLYIVCKHMHPLTDAVSTRWPHVTIYGLYSTINVHHGLSKIKLTPHIFGLVSIPHERHFSSTVFWSNNGRKHRRERHGASYVTCVTCDRFNVLGTSISGY